MFCKLCQKHSRRPKIVGVDCATMLWVDIACIRFTRQSLTNHEASESHKGAGIVQALSNVESAGKKAMIGALTCLYWLCKHEIAHTTNFSSLLRLGKSLGALYLNDLEVGRNAHYTSERFIQEAAAILDSVVSGWIFEQLKASPFLMRATNIAVVKEVIIYACYLDQKRKVQTSFIAIKEAVDGHADTIKVV